MRRNCGSAYGVELAPRDPEVTTTVRVMTYNVHRCVGTDRKLDPERIAEVIASANVDVVALQELDVGQARTGHVHQPEWLAERLGMAVHFTAARPCDEGYYGNAILSRHPFSLASEGMLRRRAGEQRAVQWLKVSVAGRELNVMNTHLSIHFRERLLQIEQLMGAEWLAKTESHLPLLICGDLNSSRFSPVYRQLRRHLRDTQCANGARPKATWPSQLPLLRLDHLFASGNVTVRGCEVLRDRLSVFASDHLPLVAELSC